MHCPMHSSIILIEAVVVTGRESNDDALLTYSLVCSLSSCITFDRITILGALPDSARDPFINIYISPYAPLSSSSRRTNKLGQVPQCTEIV